MALGAAVLGEVLLFVCCSAVKAVMSVVQCAVYFQ